MSPTTPIHRLTEVDKDRRIALCSVCGPVPIYVARADRRGRERIYCLPRRREIANKYHRKRREQKRLQNPAWKPRHALSDIDAERMMATCSVCGSTDIRKRNHDGHTIYICNTYKRAYAHEYKVAHYIPKPRKPGEPKPKQPRIPGESKPGTRKPHKPRQFGHVLSEIDDTKKTATCLICGPVRITVAHSKGRIIRHCGKAQDEYHKVLFEKNREFILQYLKERGCKRCGYNADPYKLELHNRNLYEKNLKLSRLIVMGKNRLLQLFANSDVHCTDCHYLLHHEPDY